MPDIRQDGTLSNTVTAQAISDEPPGFTFQPSQQALEESCGRCPVPSLLYEDIQHDPVLIHGAP